MNHPPRFLHWKKLVFLLALGALVPGLSLSQTTDFRDFETSERKSELTVKQIDSRELRSFEASRLQFDVFGTGDHLVWVFSDANTLHVSLGRSTPYPAEYQVDLPGQLVLLSANRLPHMSNTALVTVLYRRADRYATVGYRLDLSEEGVSHSRYFHHDWALIRPVGDFLYQQQYDMESIWAPSIDRLSTKGRRLTKTESVPLPDKPRLSSLSRADDSRWLMITTTGELLYLSGDEVLSRKQGPFGSLPVTIEGPEVSWRRSPPTETLRMAPVYSDNHRLAVVTRNEYREQGLFSEGVARTRMELYHLSANDLRQAAVVGAFNGLISDVEIPHGANPGQLLWLRRTGETQFLMEMTDLDRALGTAGE